VAVRVAEETVVVVAGGAVVVVLFAGGLLEFVVPWLDVVEALVVGGGAVLEASWMPWRSSSSNWSRYLWRAR